MVSLILENQTNLKILKCYLTQEAVNSGFHLQNAHQQYVKNINNITKQIHVNFGNMMQWTLSILAVTSRETILLRTLTLEILL